MTRDEDTVGAYAEKRFADRGLSEATPPDLRQGVPVDEAAQLVEQMKARAHKFIASCSREIHGLKRQLEHFESQKSQMVAFLAQDQTMNEDAQAPL